MKPHQKLDKRIVSKGEYAKLQSRKALLWLQVLCGVLMSCFAFYGAFRGKHHVFGPIVDGLALCLWGVVSLAAAKKTVHQARTMESVVPLTRANTADLPAADSLVRASDEPTQEQERILLRTTTHVQGSPPEELVRASVGQQAGDNVTRGTSQGTPAGYVGE